METALKTKKAANMLSPLLLLFMLAMILANLGGSMYDPFLSLYLKDLGASVGKIGLFFTISQIIPLALQILGGWVSDQLGRLRAIAIGSVVGILTYVALILAPSWEWVILAMGFGAVTRALIGPSFDAFIAEHSSEDNRARLFGVTQTLFGIVAVVGPPLGGYLVEKMNYKGMLMVASVFYICATLIRVGMAREAAKTQRANGTEKKLSFASLKGNLGAMTGLILAGGVFTWIMITDGIRDIFFMMSSNFMSLYMQDIAHLGLTQIGLMNSVFGIAMMTVMIPAGWLSDKAGERVCISSGFLLMSVAIGMIVIIPPISPAWVYGAGWVIAGLGVGLLTPAYQSLISKVVPAHLRGTAFGLFSTSLGIVSLPSPAIGAWLWEHVSPQFPFLLTAFVSLLTILPVWLKFKIERPLDDETPATPAN